MLPGRDWCSQRRTRSHLLVQKGGTTAISRGRDRFVPGLSSRPRHRKRRRRINSVAASGSGEWPCHSSDIARIRISHGGTYAKGPSRGGELIPLCSEKGRYPRAIHVRTLFVGRQRHPPIPC